MAPPYPTIELDQDYSSSSSSQYRSRPKHVIRSNVSTSPNSLRLMTELENLATREPESPRSYHSNRQETSPRDLLDVAFRARVRGSSITSQNSERESWEETPESPYSLNREERFDTTAIDCMETTDHGDANFHDDDPEERFSNPVKYFEDLQQLEEDIVDHSSLKIYDGETFRRFPEFSVLSSVVTKADDDLLNLYENHSNSRYAQTVLHLLQCRNIMFAIYDNCCKLIESDFGGRRINFLLVEARRRNVAELISFDTLSVKSLAEDFDYALSEYLFHESDCALARDTLQHLNDACNGCLMELGLFSWDFNNQPDELRWYCVCQTLDLAVLSFIGAHNQDFSRFLTNQPESFDIPGPASQLPVQITLRPRHFQCLDGLFNGKPVWVFHPSSQEAMVDEPLYLSVNMKTFSHIWGPVWAISISGNARSGVQRYDVGGGSIVPWQRSGTGDPKLLEGETFCHWLPYSEIRNAENLRITLGERDTLLIGASVRLKPNESCPMTPTDLVTRLQNSNSLHGLGTSESTFFVDSQASAISLGGWGLNVSGSRTFKRRDGQTLKAALLERWDHDRDGGRMIRDLEKGYGLEMSYCSLNAKRATLFNILRTEDMRKYLKGLDWSDEGCASRLDTILRDETVKDLYETYKNNGEWRKEIRDSILHALRVLAECVVEEANRELSIPWISDEYAHSASFSQRDISWTGFLQDTRDSCTFGLLVNKCLSFQQEGGRTCGQYAGRPVLQTSLRINTGLKDNHMHLKQRQSGEYFWSISALTKKLRFPLGSQGNLTVRKVVGGRGALLMEWTSEAGTKTFFKQALRWNGGMHHQEFIRAKWNAKERPIHVFIEAKHELPGNPKRHRKRRHHKFERGYEAEDDHYSAGSVPRITYTPDIDASPQPQPSMEIVTTESQPSAPISIPGSPSSRPRHDDEVSVDLASDESSPGSVRNRWKWDKNYKLWRRHVHTDGELDYTVWTRNPDLQDSDG